MRLPLAEPALFQYNNDNLLRTVFRSTAFSTVSIQLFSSSSYFLLYHLFYLFPVSNFYLLFSLHFLTFRFNFLICMDFVFILQKNSLRIFFIQSFIYLTLSLSFIFCMKFWSYCKKLPNYLWNSISIIYVFKI